MTPWLNGDLHVTGMQNLLLSFRQLVYVETLLLLHLKKRLTRYGVAMGNHDQELQRRFPRSMRLQEVP